MFWVSGEDVSSLVFQAHLARGRPCGRPVTLRLDYISQLSHWNVWVFSGGVGAGSQGKDGLGFPTDGGENEHSHTYIMFNVLIYVIWFVLM